jgi:hypothetical protein
MSVFNKPLAHGITSVQASLVPYRSPEAGDFVILTLSFWNREGETDAIDLYIMGEEPMRRAQELERAVNQVQWPTPLYPASPQIERR